MSPGGNYYQFKAGACRTWTCAHRSSLIIACTIVVYLLAQLPVYQKGMTVISDQDIPVTYVGMQDPRSGERRLVSWRRVMVSHQYGKSGTHRPTFHAFGDHGAQLLREPEFTQRPSQRAEYEPVVFMGLWFCALAAPRPIFDCVCECLLVVYCPSANQRGDPWDVHFVQEAVGQSFIAEVRLDPSPSILHVYQLVCLEVERLVSDHAAAHLWNASIYRLGCYKEPLDPVDVVHHAEFAKGVVRGVACCHRRVAPNPGQIPRPLVQSLLRSLNFLCGRFGDRGIMSSACI